MTRYNLVAACALVILAAASAYHSVLFMRRPDLWWPVLLAFAGSLGISLAAWLSNPTPPSRLPGRRVGVVVPSYNEDHDALMACLESLAAQTRRPDVVWVIDDCSPDETVVQRVATWAIDYADVLDVRVRRMTENRGKRWAQHTAFVSDLDVDVWVTVDSDTRLEPDALEHLLGPFVDGEVTAVAGRLAGWNWDTNRLTRAVDLEFAASFATGRAGAGLYGAVVVACGGLAAYRGDLVRRHLEDYLGETFRGREVKAGDDRRLTQYALASGRTVYQETALGWTLLPERWSHLTRQRVRWLASWWRGTLWCVRNLPFGWGLVTVAVQAASLAVTTVTIPLVVAAVVRRPWVAVWLSVYLVAMTSVRVLRVVAVDLPGRPVRGRVVQLAWAPVVVIVNLTVGLWLRWWSLRHVFTASWGTRQVVEVEAPSP